jgi:2'-5' RNA ligase
MGYAPKDVTCGIGNINRGFIAVELAAETRDGLSRLCRKLAADGWTARWTKPENMHITLRFLGSLNESQAVSVHGALKETAGESALIRTRAEGLGGFRNRGRTAVIWAAVVSGGALESLSGTLDASLGRYGFAPDDKPFLPHITLGRRNREAGKDGPALSGYAWRAEEETIGDIVLVSSETKEDGPVYSVVARYPLLG